MPKIKLETLNDCIVELQYLAWYIGTKGYKSTSERLTGVIKSLKRIDEEESGDGR